MDALFVVHPENPALSMAFCTTKCVSIVRWLVILDDLGYARKDQAETSVLFELISQSYERRSLVITCNQPFKDWDAIFPDKAMTVAAVDRLVHHATILELMGDSFRRRSAQDRKAK